MDSILGVIPFVKSYPAWVQWVISIWILGLAAIIVILIVEKPKGPASESKDASIRQEATIKDSPGANIQQFHAEKIIIAPPWQAEKRTETKKIQSLILEARLTCELKDGVKPPPDEVPFTVFSNANAYLEGPPGRVRLVIQSPIRFRQILEDNRVIVVNRFMLEQGSELFNRPVSVLGNYTNLFIPFLMWEWNKSFKKIRLLEISISINNEDPMYGSYVYDALFEEGKTVIFNVPLGQQGKR
jgi:hypothetical protein